MTAIGIQRHKGDQGAKGLNGHERGAMTLCASVVPTSIRGERAALLAVLSVAFVIRLVLAAQERVIRWDEPDYLMLGINLFSGKGYTTGVVPELHYTPLFPIILGALHQLVRNPETASNLVYMVAGTLLILPIWAIARRIYGPPVALMSACLLAVHPALAASVLYWGTMTEPLYMLLLYAGFLCALLAADDDRIWAFVACGTLLSLAYLTRPEALISLVLIVAYLVLVRLVQKRLFHRSTLLRLGGLVLAFALVAAPYLGFLYAKSGRLLLTGKLGLTYAMGQAVLNKDMAEYDRLIASLDSTGTQIVWYSPERFSYSVLDDLLSDPVAFARRTVANARILSGNIFARTIFPTFLGVPLLLGLLHTAWDRQRLRREVFLATIVASPLVAFLPFHIEIRFFSPAFPVLLVWAGNGLLLMGAWLVTTCANLRSRHPAQGLEASAGEFLREGSSVSDVGRVEATLLSLPVVAVTLFFIAMIPPAVQNGKATLDWTHKQAGLWLRENTDADAVVMARDIAVAVYAQRPFVGSPNAELDRVLSYARHHRTSYYVVDEAEITSLRPHLRPLLDEQNPPSGLVHQVTFHDGKRRTIIYRIE